MLLSDVPKMPQQSKMQMSIDNMETMRQWAREHGKYVRQRTVRQETTKYKAGILPLNMCGRSNKPSGVPVVFEENECQKELDQVSEHDSESDDVELNVDSEGKEESWDWVGRARRDKKEQGGELSVS